MSRVFVSRLWFVVFAGALFAGSSVLHAADVRISVPKRTKPTPVQQLNRDGVKAVEKHEYDRAKKLFYKAYLLDSNDPFTLNNLGYMAELDGEVDRATRYYDLAAQQKSAAVVDQSNNKDIQGKAVDEVAGIVLQMRASRSTGITSKPFLYSTRIVPPRPTSSCKRPFDSIPKTHLR